MPAAATRQQPWERNSTAVAFFPGKFRHGNDVSHSLPPSIPPAGRPAVHSLLAECNFDMQLRRRKRAGPGGHWTARRGEPATARTGSNAQRAAAGPVSWQSRSASAIKRLARPGRPASPTTFPFCLNPVCKSREKRDGRSTDQLALHYSDRRT